MPSPSTTPHPPSPERTPKPITRTASTRLGEASGTGDCPLAGGGEGRLPFDVRCWMFDVGRSLVLLLLPVLATAQADPTFTPVLQPRTWSFPRDHGRHDGFKTEWWYFTGNLREKSTGRRFGYQLTFFRSSLVP